MADDTSLSQLMRQLFEQMIVGGGESLVASTPALQDPRVLEPLDGAAQDAKAEGRIDVAEVCALVAWFLREQHWAAERDKALSALKSQSQPRTTEALQRAVADLVTLLKQCESAEQTVKALGTNPLALLHDDLDEAMVIAVADARSEVKDPEGTAQRLLLGRDFARLVRSHGFVEVRARVRQMQRLQTSNLFMILMGPLLPRDRRAIVTEHAGALATAECASQFAAMTDMLLEGHEEDRELVSRVQAMRAFLRALGDSGLAAAMQLPAAQSALAGDGELRFEVTRRLVLTRAARRLRDAPTRDEHTLMLYAYRDLLFSDEMSQYYSDFESQMTLPADAEMLRLLQSEAEMTRRCQEIGIEATLDSIAKEREARRA